MNKIWKIVNFIQASIFLPAKLRVYFLRLFGIKIGKNSYISSGCYFGSKKFSIGDNVFINMNCFFDGCGFITISDNVQFGPYCKLVTGTHSIQKSYIRVDKNEMIIVGHITIEEGVWLGVNVIILPSVTIKKGCVIGAFSLVNKDTIENSLLFGIPAKIIKNLPTEI